MSHKSWSIVDPEPAQRHPWATSPATSSSTTGPMKDRRFYLQVDGETVTNFSHLLGTSSLWNWLYGLYA
jgi:hypothetical protein